MTGRRHDSANVGIIDPPCYVWRNHGYAGRPDPGGKWSGRRKNPVAAGMDPKTATESGMSTVPGMSGLVDVTTHID